ncbi:unnamed protein product [Acanthosepion pharaonis]|uniref:Uncharacterized protein n=1 Tax=Acanthosepion pharaonis TaxID=158019 RepID=A0A812DHI4_ACAPH|nr:unnamed protein product [Sepia pharaonis]
MFINLFLELFSVPFQPVNLWAPWSLLFLILSQILSPFLATSRASVSLQGSPFSPFSLISGFGNAKPANPVILSPRSSRVSPTSCLILNNFRTASVVVHSLAYRLPFSSSHVIWGFSLYKSSINFETGPLLPHMSTAPSLGLSTRIPAVSFVHLPTNHETQTGCLGRRVNFIPPSRLLKAAVISGTVSSPSVLSDPAILILTILVVFFNR